MDAMNVGLTLEVLRTRDIFLIRIPTAQEGFLIDLVSHSNENNLLNARISVMFLILRTLARQLQLFEIARSELLSS
jgi:hypothetical protein